MRCAAPEEEIVGCRTEGETVLQAGRIVDAERGDGCEAVGESRGGKGEERARVREQEGVRAVDEGYGFGIAVRTVSVCTHGCRMEG